VDEIVVVGVPVDSVGRSGGTEHGPAALRELGLADAIGAEDRGDLEVSIRGEERDPPTGIVAAPATIPPLRSASPRACGSSGRCGR